MNYEKLYHAIIDSARSTKINPKVYYEKHHIQPRSMGGTDEESNLVKLTMRQHLLCHLLLAKTTIGRDKMRMTQAIVIMSGSPKGCSVTGKAFQKARDRLSELRRGYYSEIVGAPSTHFPLGLCPDYYLKQNTSKNSVSLVCYNNTEITNRDWNKNNNATFTYILALNIGMLGYEGITRGTFNKGRPKLKLLKDYGYISEGYKIRGNSVIYDFTDKFKSAIALCKVQPFTEVISKCLSSKTERIKGVVAAKDWLRRYNTENPLKMVELIYTRESKYIRKINAWTGNLPQIPF